MIDPMRAYSLCHLQLRKLKAVTRNGEELAPTLFSELLKNGTFHLGK